MVSPSGSKNLTVCFLKSKIQFSSHILPIPIKKYLKPGMIWASWTGRFKCIWKDTEDVWDWSVKDATWNLGACGSMLVQGGPTYK